MALNFKSNQRGTPATTNQQQQLPRRPRPRDVQRMAAYNTRQHEAQFGDSNWANQVQNHEAEEEAWARANVTRPRKVQRAKNPPVRRAAPDIRPSTVETPKVDELPYIGNGRGSKPAKRTLAVNYDHAGFTVLIRQVYDRMMIEDQRLSRSLPYCIYQHAMVEFLNAYLLHQAKYSLKLPELQPMMDPLDAISASDYNIPLPIYEYICSIGSTITPTGDKVYINLPKIAIPQGTIEATDEQPACESGSFGKPTATSHNVYECYFSPLVTAKYVYYHQTKVVRNNDQRSWNPFPNGWLPANSRINQNLLGYRLLDILHSDGKAKTLECVFDEGDTVTGRLRHCPYAMNQTSAVIGKIESVKSVKAEFKPRENTASFIFKDTSAVEDPATILWDEPATLKSPFAFSSAASNKANYFAYQRYRGEEAPGTFVLVDGQAPATWGDSRNRNFECVEPFTIARGFQSRSHLRSGDHEEEEGEGTVTQDVFIWLDTVLIKR